MVFRNNLVNRSMFLNPTVSVMSPERLSYDRSIL